MDCFDARFATLILALILCTGCYDSYPRLAFDPDASEDVCVPETTELERVIPGVFVLLDRSRSMDYDDGTIVIRYWDPAREGILNVVSELESDVAFGLGLFPDPECDAMSPNCCGMPGATVPVGLDSYLPISAALSEMVAHGGTPTSPSLDASLDALEAYIDLRAAYILLVTDGVPNCNESMPFPACVCTNPGGTCDNATQCLDDERTLRTLQRIQDQGVPTYVVGLVGATGGDWIDVMHAMAEAGGTEEATLVEDPDDVAPVLTELARKVTPCLFDVDERFFEDDPDAILIDVQDVWWGRDTSRREGWDLVEDDRIQFFGSPCDAILGSEVMTLDGEIPCQ